MASELLEDGRTGSNATHAMPALLRQRVFSRLAGHEDTNDADRLSFDPSMRHVVGGRATNRSAASTSQMGRFETSELKSPGERIESSERPTTVTGATGSAKSQIWRPVPEAEPGVKGMYRGPLRAERIRT